MMKKPFDVIREEICSRYGLDPEQVKFEVKLINIEKELAEEIVNDYGNEFSTVGTHCGIAHNKEFNLYVHYPVKEDEELVIE